MVNLFSGVCISKVVELIGVQSTFNGASPFSLHNANIDILVFSNIILILLYGQQKNWLFSLNQITNNQTWENAQVRRQSLRKYLEIAEISSLLVWFFFLYAF